MFGITSFKMSSSLRVWDESLSTDFIDGEEDGNAVDQDEDPILEQVIHYTQEQKYQPDSSKEKRAVRKRAAMLVVDRGEGFISRGRGIE